MDTAVLVLGTTVLALVFSNVVMAFALMSSLKDATLKLTALRSVDAAEAVAPELKSRRSRKTADAPRQTTLGDWSDAYAADLDAPSNGTQRPA